MVSCVLCFVNKQTNKYLFVFTFLIWIIIFFLLINISLTEPIYTGMEFQQPIELQAYYIHLIFTYFCSFYYIFIIFEIKLNLNTFFMNLRFSHLLLNMYILLQRQIYCFHITESLMDIEFHLSKIYSI